MIELLIIGFILLAVLLVFGWAVAIYNRFISLRNRIDNAWSQIDVQLKRRYDLIPNIVETVKGYAKHEKETFTAITKYRGGLVQGSPEDRMTANNMLTQALGKLMAVVENYPQLKANENFLNLQEELTGTENKIAYVRTAYNDSVMEYNTSTQLFPSSFIANMFGFMKKPYFEAEQEAKQNVKVKFE